MRLYYQLAVVFIAINLFACGGGDSPAAVTPEPIPPAPSPPPAPAPPPLSIGTQQQLAAQLLTRATFGPTIETIDEAVELGLEGWIDAQMTLPQSYHVEYLQTTPAIVQSEEIRRAHRMEAWWHIAIHADDQLRQRVAFALSEIMVISDKSAFGQDTIGVANYYDLLATHAFGNFRDLLEAVTLSPVMGMYLSMLGNEKPDTQRNIRPDENYARECMQLFTIGLHELNQDGTLKLNEQNQPIETYDQSIIEAYAHVFTGWSYAGATEASWHRRFQNYDSIRPMTPVEAFHDKGEKLLLNAVVVPANQSAYADLSMALDSLFMHPNVAPFIATRLIQRLVTSNPTPDYIQRVATVFNDNGDGVRGDMAAVIKAILLDDEALYGYDTQPERFGKLREPLLKASHLWRAFSASSPNQRFEFGVPDYFFNQAPLSSPSVFNFFLPSFTAPGPLDDNGLVAPELQIITETFVVRATNFNAYAALLGHAKRQEPISDTDIIVDYQTEVAMLEQPDMLIEHLNLLLMSGQMTDAYKAVLHDALDATVEWDAEDRVANLVFLIISSPQYAVQR